MYYACETLNSILNENKSYCQRKDFANVDMIMISHVFHCTVAVNMKLNDRNMKDGYKDST